MLGRLPVQNDDVYKRPNSRAALIANPTPPRHISQLGYYRWGGLNNRNTSALLGLQTATFSLCPFVEERESSKYLPLLGKTPGVSGWLSQLSSGFQGRS